MPLKYTIPFLKSDRDNNKHTTASRFEQSRQDQNQDHNTGPEPATTLTLRNIGNDLLSGIENKLLFRLLDTTLLSFLLCLDLTHSLSDDMQRLVI